LYRKKAKAARKTMPIIAPIVPPMTLPAEIE